ncbi:hypothetical protein LAZ67_3004938 [Cordylochernes scorpioides]|uniref:Transposase n=1 Tax=Cordylochernes scorpioides TaxID=51811 RepID=A0ABY6KBP5_9ARAC|nr:hypothetical protein LAZ67_3004938 [Cordylochernes scorpioides]
MPGHRKRRQFKQTDAFTRGMVIGLKRAGNVAIYRNVGATRVTSARVDRRILRQTVAAPQATCTAILQHVQDTLDHSISTRTISRRLVANGLHSCRPLRRLPLTPPNRRQRLEWCRARSTWMTEWHRVVFSDESRFCLSSDSRLYACGVDVEKGPIREQLWNAPPCDNGTMTAQRYVDDVLRPVTLPYLQGVPNALYQQDNARPHTARISQQALQDVQMLPWPPYSPDLSPFEHVWDIILRRLHALPQPRSEDELWQMVEREWRAILRTPSAFKEGREEVADEPRSGRPTTARTDENVDRVLEVLRTDRRLSIQQIADTLHMSTFVVHGIVTEDLQMRKVCAKFVPKVLTQDQKELRVLRCQELLDLIQNEPGFLNSVVTGDESWMFEYDQESKRQSCAWHTKSSPRPKKARMSKSRINTMIIVFFDIRGIVHCEFVPQGQTVNSAFYLEVLRRLKRRIARVRTDIKDTVKLYHDNATSHTAFIITNFLARSNTPVIPHPPYSLDLAPCDFFLFPRLKREMKGKHWETVENIQHHVTTFLRSIPVEEFQGAFQAWQTRLRKAEGPIRCHNSLSWYTEHHRVLLAIRASFREDLGAKTAELVNGKPLLLTITFSEDPPSAGSPTKEISSRVGGNQTTVMRICDRWLQKGTTDRRVRSHPPQCTTSRDDRQIVRMAVSDRSVTSRTVAHCVMHRHTGPAPGIMVWNGMGYHSRTPLVRIAGTLNSQRYISEVLEPVVLPYLQGLPTAIFQQDNARPPVARIVQKFFVNRQIELLPWPARSPDLSPIENMWSMVSQRLTQITSPAATPDQLC